MAQKEKDFQPPPSDSDATEWTLAPDAFRRHLQVMIEESGDGFFHGGCWMPEPDKIQVVAKGRTIEEVREALYFAINERIKPEDADIPISEKIRRLNQ